MTINLPKLARRANRLAKALRNAPLVILTVTVSVSLEAFGWGYIFLTNTERADILAVQIPMALIEAIIITASGLLALVAAFVAAERRLDFRPEQRRKAGAAQVLAVLLLFPPGIKAAEAWAFGAQVRNAEAYAASDQYHIDLENSRDRSLDSMVRGDAASELGRAIAPTRAKLDGEFAAALIAAMFLYGANMAAASLLWRAKPETPAERARREADAEKARRRADRRRREQIKLAQLEITTGKTRPSWLRGILSGGRKAA